MLAPATAAAPIAARSWTVTIPTKPSKMELPADVSGRVITRPSPEACAVPDVTDTPDTAPVAPTENWITTFRDPAAGVPSSWICPAVASMEAAPKAVVPSAADVTARIGVCPGAEMS